MIKPKGLGRGLDALLGGDKSSAARDENVLRELAIGDLSPGKYQPRTRMDQQALEGLAQSIRSRGIVQPILVRALKAGKFEIVAGERRWRAAQIAGLATVPVLVREIADEQALGIGLIENIQREDLNAIEEAAGIKRLIDVLNPENEPGRLTLIHRFGATRIDSTLPAMIRAVRATDRQALWVCDPMHGNTESTPQGIKTRRFENILAEVESAFRIHDENGSHLGGVHFELTGDDVTECTGGARGLTDLDLARAYHTTVDPRLNYEQALELAMLIGRQGSRR